MLPASPKSRIWMNPDWKQQLTKGKSQKQADHVYQLRKTVIIGEGGGLGAMALPLYGP